MQRPHSRSALQALFRSIAPQVALALASIHACAPSRQSPSPTRCFELDSAEAVRLVLTDFTEGRGGTPLPDSFLGRALPESLSTKYGIIKLDVAAFHRDRLGAVIDISPGFALGGDEAYRVTACGCAQVMQEAEDSAEDHVSWDATFARWHTRFLPPDSALAVDLARDAMVDADRSTDSVGRLVDSVLSDTDNDIRFDMVALRKVSEKYLLYDVVGFTPDMAGVMITLAPRRPGWSGGGRVRVTAVGCATYRWTYM
jgi:hypothetical protein